MFLVQQTVTQKMQVSLSAAKDRAQLTATTAMFLQNAAALKSLLDGGREANRWVVIGFQSSHFLVLVRLRIYPLCGIFYIPWHRHQTERTTDF